MKKIFGIAAIALAAVTLTGCSLIPGQNNNGGTKTLQAPAKGNCNVLDCINKLDTKDDLAKVNKVMGFEGELVREGTGYTTYKWVIDEDKDESIEATFYTSSTTITANIKDDAIKNAKVDFSKYNEIKTAMNSRETVTYDDVKAKFGADGVLIEKSSTSNKYRWVNSEGRYLNASFSLTSGACTFIMGRI